MKVYKPERKLYIIRELKNWTFWVVLFLFLFLLNYFIPIVSFASFLYGAGFFLILKTIDAIKEYHVKEMLIDQEANGLTAILKSRLSGNKKLNYKLDNISSEILVSKNRNILSKPTTLIIHLPGKKYYRITNRYGYATETLNEIHCALMKNQ